MTSDPEAYGLPSWQGAANARTLIGPALRAAYRIRVHGVDRVPPTGPLLLVAGHPGAIDPLLLATLAPRPVHVVTDAGPWPAPLDRWSRLIGEITVAPEAQGTALRRAAAALADGRAVGMFPEGRVDTGAASRAVPGAGVVLARTGAAVLPVAILGTRGRHPYDPPRPRTAIDVSFGDPVAVGVADLDPLRRADVLLVAERVRQVLADHVARTVARTGRETAPPVPEDGRWPGTIPDQPTRGPRT